MSAPDFSHGLEELAGLITFRVGGWHDFGYEQPPAPGCHPIPPLGQRPASAIEAGHLAVRDIDKLIRQLYDLRAQLVSELREDEDIRMARPLPGRCGDHHASGVTNCTREAGHDGAHHNGSGLTWGGKPGTTPGRSGEDADETERCAADWGSATASQRCIFVPGHPGLHQDAKGHEWSGL